jgi:hypothetical protein
MGWSRIDQVPAPIGRPVLVRTLEGEEPSVAFLGSDGVWYAGGALVQGSSTLLGASPIEWCEPAGDKAL